MALAISEMAQSSFRRLASAEVGASYRGWWWVAERQGGRAEGREYACQEEEADIEGQ